MVGSEVPTNVAKIESFGNRSLWQLINGTGIKRPEDIVNVELTKCKAKICSGLSHFKRPVSTAGELLKEKKLPKISEDFVKKLNVFLGLDELQTCELFETFLSSEYRGSVKDLKSLLSNERHAQALIYTIRDYYFTERLYLLQCLKVIVNSWQNEEHPYKESFETFMSSSSVTDGKLLKELLKMFKLLVEEPLPTWETHSVLMTSGQAYIWAMQNLKEQCEVLEMITIYMKDFSVSVDEALVVFQRFKTHGFGRRQTYKHILDGNLESLVKRIGYLEVLALVGVLDLETVYQGILMESFAEHFILKDQEAFKKIDTLMQSLVSDPSHGPLLLLWSAVRMNYCGADDHIMTRKLGLKSRELDVYQYMYNLLTSDPFTQDTSFASSVAHYFVYQLLVLVLSTFEESTVAHHLEVPMLHKVLCLVLKKPFVAEQFWSQGLEAGLGSLLQESLGKFPLDFSTSVQFSASLANASTESAEKIFGVWQELTTYTEFLDQNSPEDLMSIRDNTVWKLVRHKIPYHSKDFKIDTGTCGQEIGLGGRQGKSPIIQWDVRYNGFELLLCEVEVLLDQVSLGEGMVSPESVDKVTLITKFMEGLLNSIPHCAEKLKPINKSMYHLISRFTRLNHPRVELLAGCVSCLTCLAKRDPAQVWHNMKQTGLMPYLTENVDSLSEVLSGNVGLKSGFYGSILAGIECTQGFYPLTTAILDFIITLIGPFSKTQSEHELMAPLLFILREIFPVFQKWRFSQYRDLETIGKNCLNIFHLILNFLKVNNTEQKSNRPKLQEVCVYSLLFTEAGRSLLEIISTGSDNIEMALAQQGSIVDRGSGAELIEMIQMSLSVLNRLLLLKSPDLPTSPVETALSSQPVGRQTQHIVATITQYIFHKHNPRLPTLACLVLQRLSMVSRMSILACLGGDAESIRDMYLTRLKAVTEDLRLKVVILEFLSVCVEAQPGLIEIFLNVHPQVTTSLGTAQGQKELALGKVSCLHTVLDLMEAEKQGTYKCPADLLCACMDFIKSLWVGLRETAMSVLRAQKKFWPSVCAPLTRDLESPLSFEDYIQALLPYEVKTVASIFRIISEEVYCVTSAKLDSRLKAALSDVGKANRIKYWSKYVRNCLQMESKKENMSEEDVSENYTLRLLIAWKNFTITIAKNAVDELKVTDGVKESIMMDLLEGIQTMVQGNYTVLNIKLAQIANAQLFTLIKVWPNCITNKSKALEDMNMAVKHTLSYSASLLPPVQLGLLGSITAVLQHSRETSSVSLGVEAAKFILPTVCDVLLQSTRELPPPADLISQSQVPIDLPSAEVRLKMQVLTVCLLEELIQQLGNTETWLPHLQENLIFSSLLSSVELFIQRRQGVHYVHSAMLLLLTIAKTEKGAESLATSGFTQHICLAALTLYEDKDLLPSTQPRMTTHRKISGKSPTWHSVYCTCIDVFATLLSQLRFSFIEDALHFVGAHHKRMQQCLEMSRITYQEAAILEAEKTCDFIYELSHFTRQWRLHLGEVMLKLQTSMLYMSQTFIAFLMRPRYLQHVLDQHSGLGHGVRKMSPKQPRLQQQSSTDDLDRPSQQLVHIQHRMLVILGRTMSALRQFTPDVCEILYEQCMDYTEYEPFLAIGFTSPSTDQDTTPSFGTLMSCVRDVCVHLLTKLEPRGTSPHRSGSDVNLLSQVIPKGVILYVMENALYIIISQATRYIRDPYLSVTDKQLLKRELGTEMNYFLMELNRYHRHSGTPSSPSKQPSPRTNLSTSNTTLIGRSLSQTALMSGQEPEFFKFVQVFVSTVLK